MDDVEKVAQLPAQLDDISMEAAHDAWRAAVARAKQEGRSQPDAPIHWIEDVWDAILASLAERSDSPDEVLTRLMHIELRHSAATPGPWTEERPTAPDDGFARGLIVAATAPRQGIYANPPGGSFPASDRTFIAHSWSDVQWLTRNLRAALSALGGWNEAIETLKWYAGDDNGEQFYIVDKNGERVADFSLFSSRAKKALDALRRAAPPAKGE